MTDRIVIRSEQCSIEIGKQGDICGLTVQGIRREAAGGSRLKDCVAVGLPDVRTYEEAGAISTEIRRTFEQTGTGRRCVLTDRYRPSGAGIRWELEIRGHGAPWSTAIETKFTYNQADRARYWTAWGDPDKGKLSAMDGIELEQIANATVSADVMDSGFAWSDPLVARSFENRLMWYGAPYYRHEDPLVLYCPFLTDVICIPMVSILNEDSDTGFSIVLSPEDLLLDLTLETSEQGDIVFSRMFHRISEDQVLAFSADIVPHESDWRGGLRWASEKYPACWQPANPKALEIAGTGAYSSNEDEFDADKMKRMAFKVNWKASFDFPYMGMFLPQVGEDATWERFGGGQTSISALKQYSAEMAEAGFHVLNYFNVTEFGTKVQYPSPPLTAASEEELWRDSQAFLYTKLADAILLANRNVQPVQQLYGVIQPGRPFWTWEGAVAMDPGEPAYRDFLLEQARRHIEELPESSGICIDRMDWLRFHNDLRDDGVSWFDDGPSRSLIVSWHRLMEPLSALFHERDKVVYCNNHIKRIDLLRYIDGLFDEFTYAGAPLNTSAMLGMFKPVLGWVGTEKHLLPDPDAFFQRFLYMGVFPMAPFPGNDHSLRPSDWVDRYYLDYGPLLSALEGKQWVLEPHAIEVEQQLAKANIFYAKDGYVIPVVFGGAAERVSVTVRNLALPDEISCELIHPGATDWSPVETVQVSEQSVQVNVPLSRGCALLRIVP